MVRNPISGSELRGRTIVEEQLYTEWKANTGREDILDGMQRDFDLKLANNPYLGDPVPGFNTVFALKTTPYPPRIPSFRILYSYDPDNDAEKIMLLMGDVLPIEDDAE